MNQVWTVHVKGLRNLAGIDKYAVKATTRIDFKQIVSYGRDIFYIMLHQVKKAVVTGET